ncbi:MAG: 4Fe-4S dicluster domain-containing protein [Planctomycetota bacterium]|jgi:Fe-S-cluster-containing dehydrogenase component
MPYGFVIDQNRCIGCHACTVACKSENDVPVGHFRTWVKYTEIGTFPKVRRHFAVLRCNHCTNAPCVTICPVTALTKRSDGIVDLDRDVCIGCKACMQACPYDALYLNEDTGSAEKCHYCAHRVYHGLEPACVVVCPEEAIIAGDTADPDSKIGELHQDPDAVARRPEQNTRPNVWYLGSDQVSLEPGTAHEPDAYLWSERRLPPPPYPQNGDLADVVPAARTVLDVNHDVRWGFKVTLYLVTKGIAAGVLILAAFLGALGADPVAAGPWPELLGLGFLAVTTALLVADLKRPQLFLSILTRSNTSSWLVKGAWVLTAFGLMATAALLMGLINEQALALMRWILVPFAIGAAGYTAALFAQCEGRDLWQGGARLFVHLIAQAVFLGAAALLPLAPVWGLAMVMAVAAVVHVLLCLWEAHATHATTNARLAAALLPRIEAWPQSPVPAFYPGLVITTLAAVAGLMMTAGGGFTWFGAVVFWVLAFVGILLYEHAYVRAAQLPPLS